MLDTSTLLWALGSPERLSPRARRLVDAGENIVQRRVLLGGRHQDPEGAAHDCGPRDVVGACDRLMAASVLPVRASHVTALAALPLLHKDPFDRILIGQAVAEGLDFVTNDESIAEYSVRTIW